jgi:hypothetical protein
LVAFVVITVEEARRLLEDGSEELEARWFEVIELCSVDPAARAALADLQPRAAELEDECDGAGWIAVMLRVLHEAPFVAIEWGTRLGLAGRMSGISENFQLHTLLMDEFPQRGLRRKRLRSGNPSAPWRTRRRVSPEIAANARGEGPQTHGGQILGAWNLYTYKAVRNGALPDSSDQSMWPTWIWNEGTPAEIPELDGQRLIILAPPPYERGWSAQRTFARMPASLDAHPLSRKEVDEWFAKLGG